MPRRVRIYDDCYEQLAPNSAIGFMEEGSVEDPRTVRWIEHYEDWPGLAGEHCRVVLELATRSRVPGPSPLCLAGENASPPEDVGGPHGYAEFFKAIADPARGEHESYLRWIGGVWDPKGFDLNRVNRDLHSGRNRKS